MIVGRWYSVIENHMGKKEMGKRADVCVYKDFMEFSVGVLFKGTKGLRFAGFGKKRFLATS